MGKIGRDKENISEELKKKEGEPLAENRDIEKIGGKQSIKKGETRENNGE